LKIRLNRSWGSGPLPMPSTLMIGLKKLQATSTVIYSDRRVAESLRSFV
jgi:hypothetical protein